MTKAELKCLISIGALEDKFCFRGVFDKLPDNPKWYDLCVVDGVEYYYFRSEWHKLDGQEEVFK